MQKASSHDMSMRNILTHTQEKNHNSSTTKLLKFPTFSSWLCVICPTYHMMESKGTLIFFLRMLGHVSQACWNIIGMWSQNFIDDFIVNFSSIAQSWVVPHYRLQGLILISVLAPELEICLCLKLLFLIILLCGFADYS